MIPWSVDKVQSLFYKQRAFCAKKSLSLELVMKSTSLHKTGLEFNKINFI